MNASLMANSIYSVSHKKEVTLPLTTTTSPLAERFSKNFSLANSVVGLNVQ